MPVCAGQTCSKSQARFIRLRIFRFQVRVALIYRIGIIQIGVRRYAVGVTPVGIGLYITVQDISDISTGKKYRSEIGIIIQLYTRCDIQFLFSNSIRCSANTVATDRLRSPRLLLVSLR